MNADYQIPKQVLILSYSGLIPFVMLGVGAWMTPDVYLQTVNNLLVTYAACILAFMGAIHWGVAMKDRPHSMQLGLSIVPALLAWLSLNIISPWNYSILIVSFAVLCIVDGMATIKGLLPDWYPKLRTPLTSIVVLSLISAAIAVIR